MYLKSLSLVTCKVPHALMVVAEGPKFFEFNTSTLLEKALMALPTQIKFEQAFAFLLFILFGMQLDTSLFISSLFLVLSFILYLGKTKRVCMFGKFHFLDVACCNNWHMLHLAATILQKLVYLFKLRFLWRITFCFSLDRMLMLISTFVFLFNFHRFHLFNS